MQLSMRTSFIDSNRFLPISIILLIFFYVLLYSSNFLQARQISSSLEHFPVTVAEEGKPVDIRVRINSRLTPVYVRVYFRTLGEQNFRFADLRPSLNEYQGNIPTGAVQSPVMQYFVLALFSNQSIETLPALNPYGQPYEVIVNESRTRTPARTPVSPQTQRRVPQQNPLPTNSSSETTAFILSPDPLAEVAEGEVVIAAGFNQGATSVDPSTIRLEVDGHDYTSSAEISEFMVMLSPKRVPSGSHQVALTAKDTNGNLIPSLVWRFIAGSGKPENELATRKNYRGRVYTEIRQEKFSNQKLNANNLGGNLNGEFGAFTVDVLAYITALEDARLQPRNRFSLNIRNKFVEFGFGDLYPYYNELVLWGRRIRGVSTAFKLGFINFEYASGSTVRKIPPIYTTGTTGTDSLTSSGTFEQRLNAGRLSFGRGNNFQFGLMLLKVRDDRKPLKKGESSTTPKDNLVTGTDLLIRLDSRRIELKASLAASLLTQDISNGPATKALIDSTFDTDIPFDPKDLEKWLILNESTTPLDPTEGTSLAYYLSLRLNYFRNYFQFGLKKFGREYVSLGQTYLRNNLRGYFINDRINLFQNKVFVNLGIENYTDNFSQTDGNPQTDLTTFNYGMTLFFGQNLPLINFGVRNYVRDNSIDSLLTTQSPNADNREESISRDLNFNLGYNFLTGNVKHTANLSLINSKLIDQFSNSRLSASASRDFSNFVQSLALKSEFGQSWTTVVSFATNKNESTKKLNEIDFTMFAGRAEYNLIEKKISIYTGIRSVVTSGTRKKENQTPPVARIDYNQVSFQFGLYYLLNEKHRFVLDTDFISFNDKGGNLVDITNEIYSKNPSFNNSLIRLFYEYRL